MFRYWETNIFEAQSWSPDPFFLQHFLHLENYLKHRRVPWRTLLVLWNKIVLRRIVIHLLFLCMKNFDARFFRSEEVFPNEMFQYCETKKIDGESWCPARFLSKKTLFDLKKFLKHNRVPLRNVSVPWDFSGESWYTSPSYARKVSIIRSLWNTKRFPYEMRRYCEPKTLTRILMPTHFIFLDVFRYRKFSETQKGSLTKTFGTVKQNSFTENADTPTPLMHEKFLNQIFSETMKASLRNVSIQWDKKFMTIVTPTHFLFPNIFPKKNFWNTEGLLYEMFRYCEMKPFRRTIVTTAPFLTLTIFRFQKDLEHRKVPLRKVSVVWDQKSRRRSVMPTHFFFLNIFWHKKISETQKGSSTKCLGTVRQKLSTENRETPPPPMHEKFRL